MNNNIKVKFLGFSEIYALACQIQIENKLKDFLQSLAADFTGKFLYSIKFNFKLEPNQPQKLKLHIISPALWSSNLIKLEQKMQDFIANNNDFSQLEFSHSYDIATLKPANNTTPIKGVRNIIAISSGKGGVGKSSIAINLSLALTKLGAKVGVLDADIYGPSLPHMLKENKTQLMVKDNKFIPIKAYGLVTNSVGYMLEQSKANIWRGPAASSALLQLANQTDWGELDYLILDLPPGTGDIQLTIAKQIPLACALVISTPQEIALLDVIKGIAMFDEVDVPLLGIVENMAYFCCPHCHRNSYIFGNNGSVKVAEDYFLEVLAKIPLDLKIREDLDAGVPSLALENNSDINQIFLDLAEKVSVGLFEKAQQVPQQILFKQIN